MNITTINNRYQVEACQELIKSKGITEEEAVLILSTLRIEPKFVTLAKKTAKTIVKKVIG